MNAGIFLSINGGQNFLRLQQSMEQTALCVCYALRKMATRSFDPWLPISLRNSFAPPHYLHFFPFKSRRNRSTKCSCSQNRNAYSPMPTCQTRRRIILAATTFPFLLQLHINGTQVDASVLTIVQDAVRMVLSKAKAAGVLRLVFHDAGTFDMDESSGGMNGSIVYELDRPENLGLSKSVKILEKAKTEVEKIHPVSWADMIAVAGAEAVLLCGGPIIPVQLGRLDSMVPDPEGKLPQESLDASGLKKFFLKKGFSTQELVALSGAHTLGSKGFGDPTVFDNSYYKVLLEKPWTSSSSMSGMIGLPSDRALVNDDECLSWIKLYAGDQTKFFEDFKAAYIKLINIGALLKSV